MQIFEDSVLYSEPLAYSGLHFLLFLRLSVSPAVQIPAQDFYVPDGLPPYSVDLFLPAVWLHPPEKLRHGLRHRIFTCLTDRIRIQLTRSCQLSGCTLPGETSAWTSEQVFPSTGFGFCMNSLFSICRSIPDFFQCFPKLIRSLISFFCIISTGF